MKKLCLCLLVAMAVLGSPNLSRAEFFAAPKLGTLGFGVDLGYQFNDLVKVRLNTNYFSFSHDRSIQDIDYSIDPSNFNIGLLLDLHPWRNGFRLTGGLYYIDLKGDLSAGLSPDLSYSFGDHTYKGSELGEASGSIKWSKLAPYIGLGWGSGASNPDSNWFFTADLGAMFIGKSKVSYTVSGLASHPSLGPDIDREIGKIKSDIDDYQWYPVISIGVGYRF